MTMIFHILLWFHVLLCWVHVDALRRSVALVPIKKSSQIKLRVSSQDDLSFMAGYTQVERACSDSLTELLAKDSHPRLMSVDILTPGLNPKLEQKAIMLQEYLFDAVISLFPVLSLKFNGVKLMFKSIGDAASFEKYTRTNRIAVPPHFTATDAGLERIDAGDDCCVLITIRNHVGDNQIPRLEEIANSSQNLTMIFFNCDLSDRVTTSVTKRGHRDTFRNSIVPAFYFRNIVHIERPSLMPYEMGAIVYRPSFKWQVFAVDQRGLRGPGSLNRFMKQAAFPRNKADPSSEAPPRFVLAGRFEAQPKRDEVDSCIDKAAYVLSRESGGGDGGDGGGGGGGGGGDNTFQNPFDLNNKVTSDGTAAAKELSMALSSFPNKVENIETAFEILSRVATIMSSPPSSYFFQTSPAGTSLPTDVASKLSSSVGLLMSAGMSAVTVTSTSQLQSIESPSPAMGVVDLMDSTEDKDKDKDKDKDSMKGVIRGKKEFQNRSLKMVAISKPSSSGGDVGINFNVGINANTGRDGGNGGDGGGNHWIIPPVKLQLSFSSQNNKVTMSGLNYGPFPLEFTASYQLVDSKESPSLPTTTTTTTTTTTLTPTTSQCQDNDSHTVMMMMLKVLASRVFGGLMEIPFEANDGLSTTLTLLPQEEKDKQTTRRLYIRWLTVQPNFAVSVVMPTSSSTSSSSSSMSPIFTLWSI